VIHQDPKCAMCGKVFELRAARQKTCSAACGQELKRKTTREWNRSQKPGYRHAKKLGLVIGLREEKRLAKLAEEQKAAFNTQCLWCGDDCAAMPDDPYCSDECRWDDAADRQREAGQ
jgi:predicted nucleic acid-binding Zn ribbon protein